MGFWFAIRNKYGKIKLLMRKGLQNMIKILAIGNSFSQDATRYFKAVADSVGIDIKVVNLYIGGCPLELHAEHVRDGKASYMYQLNGELTERFVSLQEMLQEDSWDMVTIQQASGYSGLPESYEPHGTVLLDLVKSYVPEAKIWFHETWAYEQDSEHRHFVWYDNSQKTMFEKICGAAEPFAQKHGLGLIPCGRVIQMLRQLPEFDYANGGLSLCRDGFHMSLDYGRFALAATWVEVLLGGNVLESSFAPEDTDPALIGLIRREVHRFCREDA